MGSSCFKAFLNSFSFILSLFPFVPFSQFVKTHSGCEKDYATQPAARLVGPTFEKRQNGPAGPENSKSS